MTALRTSGGMTGEGSHRGAAGFSLIEVLISVFVLALGLLGVAAVFPAVVRQQRAATDAVQGISIQRSVEQLLMSHQKLSKGNQRDLSGQITDRRGWGTLAADASFSADGSWGEANLVTTDTPASPGVTMNKATGTMFVGRPDGGPDNSDVSFITIPVAERLVPQPNNPAGIEPRFVWDFVARRVPAGSASNLRTAALREAGLDDDTIQLAVFVRRIDAGIRPPAGLRLADVLTGRGVINPQDRRLPVAAEQNGRPRYDGRVADGGGYSTIERRAYSVVGTAPNVDPSLIIDTEATNDQMGQYFRQINQQFVDDLGVSHRVVEIVRDSANVVTGLRIDPPLPADLASAGWGPDRYMLFTPQIPAAVSVINVKR